MFLIGQIFVTELGNHVLFLINNDEMPEEVKCHDPKKTDPMVEEDCKAGSTYGNKGCV